MAKSRKPSLVPGPQQVAQKVMEATVAMYALNDVIEQFEQSPAWKNVSAQDEWLPFIEILDLFNEKLGQLNGLANDLFSQAFSESERTHDRAKQSQAGRTSKRK